VSAFDLRSRLDLAAPLGPADAALARWVRAHGGSARLAELAAWLRLAEGEGDSCLPLDRPSRHGFPGLEPAALAALRDEPLVGAGDTRSALVLDARQRLYFWRSWQHERRIADCLRARLDARRPAEGEAAALAAVFADSDPAHDAAQRAAVQRALRGDLLILTGGPGTGKTRTALRLLLARQLCQPEVLRLVLAAPTGKAAQRLAESLRTGAAALAPQAPPALATTLDRLAAQPVQTVHRALGWSPSRRRFSHGHGNRLAADLVLVDEVSMLDLGSLRALCDAVPAEALLVLMGDAEQLVSVAAGSVLDDVVRALAPLPGSPVVRLEHGFRSQAALAAAIAAARQGDGAALRAAFAAHPQVLRHQRAVDGAAREQLLADWSGELQQTLGGLPQGRGAEAAMALLAAWQQQQLLCARRDGAFGASTLAAQVEARLRSAWGQPAAGALVGGALLVAHNDYVRQLFNGDLGVLLPDHDGRLRAWFAPLQPGEPARAFAPGDLPAHASAAAITVHKSQGSEYARIALLLPPQPELPLLSRQLVYTALSRARQRIDLCADDATLDAALARRSERVGGLRERLAGDAAAASG
jgi:exodeoxyribonuclease V alpha subunit